MPSQTRHSQQARHNEEFFLTFDLTKTPYVDWAIISMFYSALHLLEAYLAGAVNYHPSGHADRDRVFERFSALKPIYGDYRILKDYSEDARYRVKSFSGIQVQTLYDQEFNRVKSQLAKITPPPKP